MNNNHEDNQLESAAPAAPNAAFGIAQWEGAAPTHPPFQDQLEFVASLQGDTTVTPPKGRREHDAALLSIREEFTGRSTPLSVTTEYRPPRQ